VVRLSRDLILVLLKVHFCSFFPRVHQILICKIIVILNVIRLFNAAELTLTNRFFIPISPVAVWYARNSRAYATLNLIRVRRIEVNPGWLRIVCSLNLPKINLILNLLHHLLSLDEGIFVFCISLNYCRLWLKTFWFRVSFLHIRICSSLELG